MIRLVLVSCLMVFALEAYGEMGADYCSGQAQADAQAAGGDPSSVKMTYSSPGSIDINSNHGFASYSFQHGAETCSVFYDIFAWYGGIKCSSTFGNMVCPKAKAHPRRHR